MMLLETITGVWLRIRALFRRSQLDRDLDDELRFHLAMRQQKLEASGLSPDEAASAVRRRFGNATVLQETSRALWTFGWLEALRRDFRYAARILSKSPLFTLVALATLAFGIGANTAIFSVFNGILLRAMPYERPQEIYAIREVVTAGGERHQVSAVNGGNYLEWKQRTRSFASIALLEPTTNNLLVDGEAVQIHGLRASASLFPMLGIRPRIGRSFTPEEDDWGRGMQMILTHALWRDRFASNSNLIGKTISLNGYPCVVIGVLPESFYFPKQEQLYGAPIAGWTFHADYFLNLAQAPWERKPGIGVFNFAAIGRVRPGSTRQQANAELETIEQAIGEREAAGTGASLHADLVPLKAAIVGPAERRLWMLMGGAGLILLIVCVNLAGLMLGRNTARAHEVAIRCALGASRWTLIRQFTAEGLLLSLVGGAAGVLAASIGIDLLIRNAPITLPRLESISLDGRALLFSAGIAVFTGILCSLLPALRMADRNIEDTLRSAAPNLSAARKTAFLHDLLAGSEITLCTVLLICALLLGQSLGRVLQANSWLDVEHVLTFDLSVPPSNYQTAETRIQLYRKLLYDSRELSGVTHTGMVSGLPLRGENWGDAVDLVEIPVPPANIPVANFRFVSPGYNEAIGLPIVAGRPIQELDSGHSVMLISESVARLYPGRNLIGMHMKWREPVSQKPLSLEVAGILGDVRTSAEEAPALVVYIPNWIWPPWNPSLVVRTSAGRVDDVAAEVQRLIRRTDGRIAVPHAETLRHTLNAAVASRRFLTRLGVVFAACATFLAALGLYGVLSLAVTRRRREIGIRMALGASHPQVFRMVVLKALKLGAAGVAAGLLCGAGIARLIASLLYEVRPADPATFVAASVIVMGVALLASSLPARRAAKLEPLVALKYE